MKIKIYARVEPVSFISSFAKCPDSFIKFLCFLNIDNSSEKC